MPAIFDRVAETTTTTGTGALTLGGAITGMRAWSAAATSGAQAYYLVRGTGALAGEWEVGIGTPATGTPWTISRDTVIASSNANALVNFSAGTKEVLSVVPAQAISKKGGEVNEQTGTTYTFALTDAKMDLITFGNAAATTVTVPPNSSVPFPINTRLDCIQDGAGKVTFAGGAGVTILSSPDSTKKAIAAQYVGVTLIKKATDTWYLIGNLVA